MTHTATSIIPLTWRQGYYSYERVLTDESINDIKNLFIEKLGEDFCNYLSFTKVGIEVNGWTGKRMLGREKEGIITKIKEKSETFDFSTVEKKYTELARIAKQNVELENRRKNREKAISDFIKTVSIEGVKVDVSDWSDKAELKVGYQNVKLSISNDGIIENAKIEVPTSYKSLEDTIAGLQNLLVIEKRIKEALIGKNIYA